MSSTAYYSTKHFASYFSKSGIIITFVDLPERIVANHCADAGDNKCAENRNGFGNRMRRKP